MPIMLVFGRDEAFQFLEPVEDDVDLLVCGFGDRIHLIYREDHQESLAVRCDVEVS